MLYRNTAVADASDLFTATAATESLSPFYAPRCSSYWFFFFRLHRCHAKPKVRRRQCSQAFPFFRVAVFRLFASLCAPRRDHRTPLGIAHTFAIGVHSRFTAFATRLGRARAYCRESVPSASGTLRVLFVSSFVCRRLFARCKSTFSRYS